MSKWRSDMATSRRQCVDRTDARSPVAIVHIDLDAPPDGGVVVDSGTSRAWIEVSRHGTVVGRTELAPSGGVLQAADLAQLRTDFPDDGAGTPEAVADGVLPFISVVVPTICKEPEQLARTIQALLDLAYPRFEVLVVDNTASGMDVPVHPAFADGRVKVLREPRPGVSSARNCGVRAAAGEIVAFTDDDAVVDANWLRGFGARFAAEPSVVALGGLVLPGELTTAPQLWFEEFYGGFSRSYAPASWNTERPGADDPLFPYAAARFGAGCNMAFRADTLRRMGGFDDSLGAGTPARGGEDLLSFVTLVTSGATVGFEPSALVRHTHRRTEREFFGQVFSYGIGLTAMYAALVAHEPRHAVEMVRRIPHGAKLLFRPRGERSVSTRPSYPRRTILVQLAGMVAGPFAYLRSRRWAATRP